MKKLLLLLPFLTGCAGFYEYEPDRGSYYVPKIHVDREYRHIGNTYPDNADYRKNAVYEYEEDEE